MASPLDEWAFLIGEWRGESEGQFGEKGAVVSTATFSRAPGEKFIMGTGESRREGQLLNESVSFLSWDPIGEKFRRKTVFSYGFVNNEVERERKPGEIVFDVIVEPNPRQFEGLRWRSHIRRIDDTHVAVGLASAKGDGPFENYGETVMVRRSV